jgi:selenocysteine-specific elongation factor
MYHANYPLRTGMPKEAFRSRLGLDGKLSNRLINFASESGLLIDTGQVMRLPDHEVKFKPREQAAVDQLMQTIAQNPAAPPSIKESLEMVGDEVLQALIERGDVVQLSEDVLLGAETYRQWLATVESAMRENGSITVAQARDLLGSSRKYVLAFLEYLDRIGITKRTGDERVLR